MSNFRKRLIEKLREEVADMRLRPEDSIASTHLHRALSQIPNSGNVHYVLTDTPD